MLGFKRLWGHGLGRKDRQGSSPGRNNVGKAHLYYFAVSLDKTATRIQKELAEGKRDAAKET